MQAEVPDVIYQQAVVLAEREKVPMERLLGLARARAVGARQTGSVIAQRANRGSRDKLLAVLAKAPGAPPLASDEPPALLELGAGAGLSGGGKSDCHSPGCRHRR